MFGILTWMILALTLMLCAFIVGIFLIIYGIKYHKSLTIIAGLISILLIVVPIVCIGSGIDLEGMVPISGTLYWCFFSLAGLLAIISGRQISSICSMGIILFLAGLCSVTGYHFFISHSLKRQKSREINSLLFYLVYCLIVRRTITPKRYLLVSLRLRRHR